MTGPLFDGSLSITAAALLVVAMAVALGFEFVNGFHDTANAVATVIYTRSLGPRRAVVWSGVCNFLGVYLGGTAVAFSVVNLLPVDLLVTGDTGSGLAMILALLLAAIAWNLGTWWLGLPASSSHTLIGAILGVGLVNAALSGRSVAGGVNWEKAGEVGLSLMVSPLVGFTSAALLLLTMRRLVRKPELYQAPSGDAPPPFWVRSTLVATCTGVSFAHGSNDGQKGIGLVMLILIGILPAHYALNPRHGRGVAAQVAEAGGGLGPVLDRFAPEGDREGLSHDLKAVRAELEGKKSLGDVPRDRRWNLRARLIRLDRAVERLLKAPPPGWTGEESARAESARKALGDAVYYAPTWVLIAVAGALGVGTTVGWQRIVTTVGEKIGKSHLTYAQGAAAEVVAAATIGLADVGGLPVSTTHVLSSGVAGTMAASRTGLQYATVRNIALAWLLTLPASMALAAVLFTLLRPVMTGLGVSHRG
jgi:PiT family inorganic phosphate transporter